MRCFVGSGQDREREDSEAIDVDWHPSTVRLLSMTPNQSLERTSTSWPRYAQQFIIASRGQLVPAPQLQR